MGAQQKLRIIDTTREESSGTATHKGVDQVTEASLEEGSSANGDVQLSYEEGFGASSGIRPEVAETGGRAKAPEMQDDAIPDRTPDSLEKENAGLADR